MFQVWPYLLGVYSLDSSEDARRTHEEDATERYRKLTLEWQAARLLALQREQDTISTDFPLPKLSTSEDHNHDAKMALFRKESTLSNDVFESLDAPVGIANGDEICRPETVIEETSSVSSPVVEAGVGSQERASGSELECSEVIGSLPVKPGT